MNIESTLTYLSEWLSKQLPINTVLAEIIVSIGILVFFMALGWGVYHAFNKYFSQWAKKTKTTLDDEILKNIKAPIYGFVLVIGVYFALYSLSILDGYRNVLGRIFAVIQILFIALIIIRIINVIVAWYGETRASKSKMTSHFLFLIRKMLQVAVIIFAVLSILSAFDVDLTGAAVGLGIGGLAIALALQNILKDIFNAFTIFFDKPFEIGDYIVIGSDRGIVKKIGIVSTRIQTLQGEELVISNNEMINTRIHNFKKMKKRRITFGFGVIYGTPTEKLKKIPDIVQKIMDPEKLKHIEKMDRIHFKEFGSFSLNFECVYFVKSGDYVKYMDTQQEINFKIKEAFEKEGIEMAFPTQTIFMKKE